MEDVLTKPMERIYLYNDQQAFYDAVNKHNHYRNTFNSLVDQMNAIAEGEGKNKVNKTDYRKVKDKPQQYLEEFILEVYKERNAATQFSYDKAIEVFEIPVSRAEELASELTALDDSYDIKPKEEDFNVYADTERLYNLYKGVEAIKKGAELISSVNPYFMAHLSKLPAFNELFQSDYLKRNIEINPRGLVRYARKKG